MKVESLPNLFLIGAPKCGTTSLFQYLGQHPAVFVPECKEPNYFARDLTLDNSNLNRYQWHTSWAGYCALFASAEGRYRLDASTRYLRHQKALEEISAKFHKPKIIVSIRNPVDLVVSWHAQKIFEGQETESDFETAWALQEKRRQGSHLPAGLIARDALDYWKVASLGTQLENVYRIFPRDHVLVIFFDDLKNFPRRVYLEILQFLELQDNGCTEFSVLNQRKHFRSRMIPYLIGNMPMRLRKLIQIDQFLYHPRFSWLFSKEKGQRCSAEFMDQLKKVFSGEVRLIETLTGRTMSEWNLTKES